jgi:hypothetical protein
MTALSSRLNAKRDSPPESIQYNNLSTSGSPVGLGRGRADRMVDCAVLEMPLVRLCAKAFGMRTLNPSHEAAVRVMFITRAMGIDLRINRI